MSFVKTRFNRKLKEPRHVSLTKALTTANEILAGEEGDTEDAAAALRASLRRLDDMDISPTSKARRQLTIGKLLRNLRTQAKKEKDDE
jgi:hypothetical protein